MAVELFLVEREERKEYSRFENLTQLMGFREAERDNDTINLAL